MSPCFEEAFSQCIPNFLAHEKSRDLGERSLKELNSVLEKLKRYAVAQKIETFSDFTPQVIKDFILFQNPNNSPSQAKMLIWVLRKFFGWLVLNKDLPQNPAAGIQHPKISPQKTLPDYLSEEELDALMKSAFSDFSIQESTIISLMTTTGLRPHEVAALEVEEVKLSELILLHKVKGGWHKRGPITQNMAEQFEDYFEETGITEGRVFRNHWDDPIDTSWIRRMIGRVAQKAGIERKINPKMLRHTFATYAAQRHGKTVTRALLGHCATSHSTNNYMHLLPSRFHPLMQAHPFSRFSWRPDKHDKKFAENQNSNPGDMQKQRQNQSIVPIDYSLPKESGKIITDFLEYYQKIRNVTAATIKSLKSMCYRWAYFLHEYQSVKSLTLAQPQHVVSWIGLQHEELKVKDTTIEHQLCCIRTLHEYILDFEKFATNPCKGLPSFICRSNYERSFLSVNEVFAMLATFDRMEPLEYHHFLIIAFLWSTGLRTSEFLSLKWRDFNVKEGLIKVRVGKGQKQRLLFLNRRMHNALKQYKKEVISHADMPLFAHLTGRTKDTPQEAVLTPKVLTGILEKAAQKAGITRKVNPLIMRHSFATHLFEAGIALKDIQEMMGHSNTEETTIYVHVTVNAAKQLLNEHVYHTLQFRGKHE